MGDSYLVTGGAGFIGSNIVDELLARGHRVRVLDNFSTGRCENLTHVLEEIELIEGDIRSYERVHAAVEGMDYVIHEAALPSVPRSVQDPLTSNEVNVTGTTNLLLAARDAKVRRVVLASSSSVYGANAELPKNEKMLLMPISPYGVTKLAAEHYCLAFQRVYGVETAIVRYFNVFGPRQSPYSQYSAVIAKFLGSALTGRRPTIFGDGTQSRDFTYVSNVVNGTLAAAHAPEAAGEAINLACGDSSDLLELISLIESITGSRLSPKFSPERPGDIKHSYADIGKAKRLLNYEPLVTFAQGLEKTAQAQQDFQSLPLTDETAAQI